METVETKQIPSCHDYYISKDGVVFNSRGKVIKGFKSKDYCFIKLKDNKGARKNRGVHRLVYEAWAGELIPGLWINHKDGNRANNHIDNLELLTPSENIKHSFRELGKKVTQVFRFSTGVKENYSLIGKLSRNDVIKILQLSKDGFSQRKIADMFKVSQVCICQIVNKKIWKDITPDKELER